MLDYVLSPDDVQYLTRLQFPDKTVGTIRTLTIPEGVTVIGPRAFEDAELLTNITIPDGVTKIGKRAFCFCANLLSVELPETLEEIDDEAFMDNYLLHDIVFPKSLLRVNDRAFFECMSLTTVSLPGVREVGADAFSHCRSLRKLRLNPYVIFLGSGAFSRNRRLVHFPELWLKEPSAYADYGRAFHDSTCAKPGLLAKYRFWSKRKKGDKIFMR